MSDYIRKCPQCQGDMLYTTLNRMNASEKRKSLCRSCLTINSAASYKNCKIERHCPSCNDVITYTNKQSYSRAVKADTICKSCASVGEKNGMFGKESTFKGRTHTAKSKAKISKGRLGHVMSNEAKTKISKAMSGNGNPMFGKNVYSVWIEKYGSEVADIKMKQYKKKQSILNLGELNSMFGRPSPQGSGNGYSGWYRGDYFRSLRELIFMIYCDRFKLSYKSLELKKYAIPYIDYAGNNKNYFGDYLVNEKFFVEIKPKRLWNTPSNSLKFEEARTYCSLNNLKFKLIDPPLNYNILKRYHDRGSIKFLPKYESKFNAFKP